MNVVAVATREGWRLLRSSRTRSAFVAITIGVATVIGVIESHTGRPLVAGCVALAFSTLVVARRSPRPERTASVHAWSRAGASAFAVWLAGVAEALLLGWVPTLVVATVVVGAVHAANPAYAYGPDVTFVAWQLGLLGLAACLPTARVRSTQKTPLQRVEQPALVALANLIACFALVLMFRVATSIRSDFDLGISGFIIITLLIVVGLIVTGQAARGLVEALGHVRSLRAVAAIAVRYRAPATVRLVIVTAVTIATAAAILGASVQSRPDFRHTADAQIARLPVLPRNVALVRLNIIGLAALDQTNTIELDASRLAQLRGAVARISPGAETIALRDVNVVAATLFCDECDNGPLVVADRRLNSIYSGKAAPQLRAVAVKVAMPGNESRTVPAITRLPAHETLTADVRSGKPLPPATFNDAQYYEISRDTVNKLHLATTTRSVFIRTARPITTSQLARLVRVTRALAAPPRSEISLIGPGGQLLPSHDRLQVDVSASLRRDEPWAAATAGSRWSWAVTAGLVGLVALLVTMAIDTIDRRRDVQRLERLGATPGQVRGAAALYAAALFLVVTWLTAIVVMALVKAGTASFNRAEPGIPVPFRMPWLVVLFLTIGLPAIAGGLSALVARPTWIEQRPL